MAELKKNQLNQILFVAVDATDFASIESGISASDFDSGMTKKFFGVNHGTSAAMTSGTISKAVSLVRSGVFRQTLKAAECNYDYLMVSFKGHASLADLTYVFQTVNNDDSDLMSRLSDIGSDLRSVMLVVQSMVSDVDSQLNLNASLASDAHSAAAQANSRALVIQSLVSDVDSQLLLNASLASDAHSAAAQANSRALVIQSLVSDVESALDSQFVYLSNVLSDMQSDLGSQIDGVTATLSVSDISDIASRVWSEKYGAHSLASSFGSLFSLLATDANNAASAAQQGNSRVLVVQSLVSDVDSQLLLNASLASDAHSAAAQANSRALLIQSIVSDVQSALDSQFVYASNVWSDMHSDLRSIVSTQGGAVTASDISDIASAVQAIQASRMSDILSAAQQGNSRALVIQSLVSDVDSQLLLNASMISDVQSALDSQFVYLSNALSDMQSDLRSIVSDQGGAVTVSNISDIASAVWAFTSRVLTSQLNIHASDMSDLRSAIAAGPAATVTASDISDIASAVQAIQASRMSDILSAAAQANSRALVVQSIVSDIQSALDSQFVYASNVWSDMQSDLRSAISTVGGGVTVSNISDIASAVQAIQASRMSDILSAAVQANSRALVIQSIVSDVQSALDSEFAYLSAAISDVDSQVLLNASMASDAASAAQQAASRALVVQSRVSDIESQLDVTQSLVSDIDSQLLLNASLASDAASAAQQANSRALAIQSLLSDVESQIDAGVTIGASSMSDIASRVWATAGADPTGVPAVGATMAAKLDWLTALSRNKITQTSALQVVRNDADSADIASAVVSDDGTTATREEWA